MLSYSNPKSCSVIFKTHHKGNISPQKLYIKLYLSQSFSLPPRLCVCGMECDGIGESFYGGTKDIFVCDRVSVIFLPSFMFFFTLNIYFTSFYSLHEKKKCMQNSTTPLNHPTPTTTPSSTICWRRNIFFCGTTWICAINRVQQGSRASVEWGRLALQMLRVLLCKCCGMGKTCFANDASLALQML